MARPRSAGYDLQREQMLAAAAQLFATQGYTATTMQQVAESGQQVLQRLSAGRPGAGGG